MPRESEIILRFGTRAALNAAATAGQLSKGEPFLIDDENRLGIALSASTYETAAKQSEASGGGLSGTATITLPREGSVQWEEVVAAPGAAAGKLISCTFAPGEDADENEAWALSPLHPPIAQALAGEIIFTVQFATPEAGPIKINWRT
jgi:hypothetical protein